MYKFLKLFGAFIALYFFIIPKNSYAYLDPGTGSYLLQIIAAALFTGLFFMKNWWKKLKEILSRILSRKLPKKDDEEESSKKTKGRK